MKTKSKAELLREIEKLRKELSEAKAILHETRKGGSGAPAPFRPDAGRVHTLEEAAGASCLSAKRAPDGVLNEEGGGVRATDTNGRGQAEESVGIQYRRLHGIFEMLPTCVLLLTPDYRVALANRFFRERFGESHGRRCFEYLFGRKEPCEVCNAYKILRTNAPCFWEWKGPDGRIYSISDFPFQDADGSPLIMEVGIDITEFKLAEGSLREANDELEQRVAKQTAELAQARIEAISEKHRLEAVMKALPVGVVFVDAQGGVVQANDMYEQLWRSPRPMARDIDDYAAYKAWWADTGERVRPEEWASARAVRKGETVIGQVMEIESFDGARKFVINSAAPLRDAEGKIIGSAVAVQDITELKRTGELLAALQEKADLLNLAHDAIIVHDLEFRIVYWNQGAEVTYGWRQEEARGKAAHELLQAQAPLTWEEILAQVLEKGEWEGELCHTTRSGAPIVVASRQTLQKNGQGAPTGILQINRDITKRRHAEEQLNQANILLQSVFDGISEPLFMVDGDLRVQMRNQAAHRYFQAADIGEVVGNPCFHLIDGKCEPCGDCVIGRSISQGRMLRFERQGLFDPERIEQVTVYPLSDTASGISGAIIRVSDLTEARKTEQHLVRADRLSSLGQLSAGIAHEIRNPLAGINLFIDVLADEERFSRTGQELEILDEIKRNIQKMDGIIRRVLDFSRQSQNKTRQRLDMSQVIDDTLSLWRSAMARAGIALNLSVAKDLPQVSGDPVELQQVLNNLVQNAVDVMSQGGTLSISAREGAFSLDGNIRAIIVGVQDTGPGIPTENQGSIFNPFYTTKPAGTGLGLAICHRIVSGHGGTICLKSSTRGGTVFQIEFPVAGGD